MENMQALSRNEQKNWGEMDVLIEKFQFQFN